MLDSQRIPADMPAARTRSCPAALIEFVYIFESGADVHETTANAGIRISADLKNKIRRLGACYLDQTYQRFRQRPSEGSCETMFNSGPTI